jgi:hypothetical protein
MTGLPGKGPGCEHRCRGHRFGCLSKGLQCSLELILEVGNSGLELVLPSAAAVASVRRGGCKSRGWLYRPGSCSFAELSGPKEAGSGISLCLLELLQFHVQLLLLLLQVGKLGTRLVHKGPLVVVLPLGPGGCINAALERREGLHRRVLRRRGLNDRDDALEDGLDVLGEGVELGS